MSTRLYDIILNNTQRTMKDRTKYLYPSSSFVCYRNPTKYSKAKVLLKNWWPRGRRTIHSRVVCNDPDNEYQSTSNHVWLATRRWLWHDGSRLLRYTQLLLHQKENYSHEHLQGHTGRHTNILPAIHKANYVAVRF